MKTFRFLLIAVICILAGGRGIALGQCVPPPSGMVAWWPLDETSSPANDLAGVNNVGTWMNNPTPVSGKVAGALSFNGTNHVEAANHAELNLGTGSFSIDAWVKRDTASTNSPPSMIVDKRDPVSGIGYSLAVSYGRLIFLMSGTNYATTTYPVPADDQWHHVAVTVNRVTNVVQFYGNGIPLDALPFTSPPGNLDNTNSFWIGKGQLAGNQPWLGCIDELEIFKRALDSTEIRGIWAADSLGKCKPARIQGLKFEDLDCDGLLDQGEPFLSGWSINLYQGTTFIASTTTGPDGSYWFIVPAPGTYTITEAVQSGWVQKSPSFVSHQVTLLPGDVTPALLFGNCPDTCDELLSTVSRLDGVADNFAPPPKPSSPAFTNPGDDLFGLFNLCIEGTNNFFDSPIDDRCFGHTFSFWDSTCCVLDAQLCLRIRAISGGADNDAIAFAENGVLIWGRSLKSLTISGTWNTGQILDTCLDLDNLPPSLSGSSFGVTNVLAALQDGDFSILILDDTEIDYLELRVTLCCHPDTLRNHFKTWRIQPLPFDTTVFVQDQFNQDTGMVVRLDTIDFLSNPVKKIVANDTFNITRPNDHLTWYRAKSFAPTKRFKVQYVNQFESTTLVMDTLRYLLLPTQKDPHPEPDSLLGHYTAYRVKNPKAFSRPVQLQDQFDPTPEFIDSLVPVYFLTPAQKNNEPRFEPDTHYVAYEIIPQRVAPQTKTTHDQFGSHFMQIWLSELLLVPTNKVSVKYFKAGDANGDGKITVSDVVFLINYLFKGGPAPDPVESGDVNCDGKVTVSDVVYLINYLFKGGPPPR